jgi:hypothetical protein
MSSISSVSSVKNHDQANRVAQDFQAIGKALQSGDLATAQSGLASFQQALQQVSSVNPQTLATQPFGANSQANADYLNLASAVHSGDLAGARKDFASLQNDLKPLPMAHHHQTGANAMSGVPLGGTAASAVAIKAASLNEAA